MALRTAYNPGAPTAYHGMHRTEKCIGQALGIPILAADLATTGNQIGLFVIPAGFVLTRIQMDTPQLDSGTGLTVSIGDLANPTRFLNASTAFRAQGANIMANVFGVAGYQYPADTALLMTIAAAAATPVPGTLICQAVGWINA